jgi:hypothetical protein
MSKKNTNKESVTFRFTLNKLTVVLCIAVLLLCGLGIATSVIRILKNGVHGFSDALKSPFLILICLFCIAVVVSILIRSQYTVDDEFLTTQFGFIKNKISVQELTSIELDTTAQKLTLYSGENFSVVSINKEWNDAFIKALLKANPNIEYAFTLTDNVPPEEK